MGDEMQDRLSAAEALAKAGRYDAATTEFVWLWENMDRIEPSMRGVRVSFMAKYIEDLVDKHPPARQRFSAIRDRAASLAETDGPGTLRVRFDWMVLNEILGEQDRTLVWFDGVKDDERYAPMLDRLAPRLIPLLRSHQRLRDIGSLYKDPTGSLTKGYLARRPPPGFKPEVPAALPANLLEWSWRPWPRGSERKPP